MAAPMPDTTVLRGSWQHSPASSGGQFGVDSPPSDDVRGQTQTQEHEPLQKPMSCLKCRQRKVKCDKLSPCTGCQHSGTLCIYPSRQERSRHRARKAQSQNSELVLRLNRLEAFLDKYEPIARRAEAGVGYNTADLHRRRESNVHSIGTDSQSQTVEQPMINAQPPIESANGSMDRYVSSDFWRNLSDQISGMKEFLNEFSGSDEDEMSEFLEQQRPASASPNTGDVIFGVDSSQSPIHPSKPEISLLYNHYIAAVHPVTPILHRPSLQLLVQDTINDPSSILDRKPVQAILFAVYFSAVTSMEESECIIHLGVPKHRALLISKANVEKALVRADLLNRLELATLQALTIYLFTIRTDDHSPASWILTSLAVRIAYGLGLHREAPGGCYSPFQTEMRRRLWWELVSLDIRASEDRGSMPLIDEGSYNTRKPANINDEDFSPASQVVVSSNGWTDTTLGLIIYEFRTVSKKINYTAPSSHGDLNFEQKLNLAMAAKTFVAEKYWIHCNTAIPFQWFALKCTQLIFSRMLLIVQYPLRRAAPQLGPSSQNRLRNAITVVEDAYFLESKPDAARWSWCTRAWSSWHALAILLAELSIETSGALSHRGWTIVEIVFEPWGRRVADSDRGMLWRPIKKLYDKALEARRNGNRDMNDDHRAVASETNEFSNNSFMTLPSMLDFNLYNMGITEQDEGGTMSDNQVDPGIEASQDIISLPDENTNMLPWNQQYVFPLDSHGGSEWM